MKTLLQIQIIELDDGSKALDVLKTGYNIIEKTIYNNDIAEQVLQIINASTDE